MIQRNLMCLLLLCIAVCRAVPAQENKPPSAKPAPVSSATGSDLVVLTILGEPISEKRVVTEITQLAQERQIPPDPKQPRNMILFQGAVDNIITTTVLRSQAKQLNVVPDKAMVDQQMQTILKQFPSQEAFQKALAGEGLTEDKLRQNIVDTLSMQQLINQAIKDVPQATDEEIQKFFEDNPKNFFTPEQVRASHILLMVDPKGTPGQREEVKKKIDEIRADIESNKITFEDAAIKYSQDKSNGPKGGDLGFFARGQMVKQFDEAAFALKPGILSPVVETEFGFHLIKVSELKPVGKVTLEEAKPKIKQYLETMSRRKVTQQYVNDLKSKAAVEKFMTAEEFLKRHPEIK